MHDLFSEDVPAVADLGRYFMASCISWQNNIVHNDLHGFCVYLYTLAQTSFPSHSTMQHAMQMLNFTRWDAVYTWIVHMLNFSRLDAVYTWIVHVYAFVNFC